MLGHVLADRYLGPGTRPGATELRGWLDTWGRHPDAPAIHALLLGRLPRGSARPPAPAIKRLVGVTTGGAANVCTIPVPEESEPSGQAFDRRPALDVAVRNAARTGPPGAAARLIARAPGLPALYGAQLKGEAAQILFALNRGEEAYENIRDNGDPLLSIEAMPVDETRAFIPRVLTYSWIYAARLRRPTTSLTELADGRWPQFAPMLLVKTASTH